MYLFLIIMHVISCLVLIGVILLQAGKGGGIAETFGGSGFQNILGNKATTFLTKATLVCAVMFLTTSLTLALLSAKRGESIVDREVAREERAAETVVPVGQKETQTAPAAQEAKPSSAASGEIPAQGQQQLPK